MSAKTAAPLLKSATDHYSEQNLVAIIGNQGSGKTVVGTLLKDAIFTYFDKDEFSFNLLSGSDILEETEESIFTDKVFPPPSRPRMESKLVFEVVRAPPLGNKILFHVRDISGEDFKLAFLGGDVSAETRVNNVLALKKDKEPLGPFSYLIFAKLYAILIDCSEFDNWKTIQTRQSQMLNSLLAFKKVLGEIQDNGKFTTPLAIVLTKTDTLKNGIEGSPENMIKKYMPQFHTTLSHVHDGPRQYFSLFIVGEKPTEDSQKQEDVKEEQDVLPSQKQEDVKEEQDALPSQTPIKKIIDPISYSNGEYVKFILWVIEKLS